MKITTMASGGIKGYLNVKLSNAVFNVVTIARGVELAEAQDEWSLVVVNPSFTADILGNQHRLGL